MSTVDGWRRPHWAFPLVDVDQTEIFLVVNSQFLYNRKNVFLNSEIKLFKWSTSTRLRFSSGRHRLSELKAVDVVNLVDAVDAVDVHFYWAFHHAPNASYFKQNSSWKCIWPFQKLNQGNINTGEGEYTTCALVNQPCDLSKVCDLAFV